MLDVAQARRDTPAVENLIHFNNAGASLMPDPVANTLIGYIQEETRTGGYETARRRAADIERFYSAAAALLNGKPEEIAFIENATRAWDMAFYSLRFNAGDKILTGQSEYVSNYIGLLQAQKRFGVEIVVIPNDAHGQIDVMALEAAIDARVKLIAITHVPSTGGLVNPAEAVGAIARRHDILYLLDACQSVGQRVVDVQQIGCDFLSVTGRKFLRGPRATGFLWVKQSRIASIEPVLLDLHSATWVARDAYVIREDARRFENWEMNYAGKAALAVALDYALTIGMDNIQARVMMLAEQLRALLRTLRGVTVRDLGMVQGGIVTFTVDNEDHYQLRDCLAEQHINVSVSPLEYSRLDMEARGIPDMLRASVHYYNTEAEIARFCEVLAELSPRTRT